MRNRYEPCPSPWCRLSLPHRVERSAGDGAREFYVVCQGCGMRGPHVFVPAGDEGPGRQHGLKEAERRWNELPRQEAN